jgi:shikimate dehydrogenase
VHPRHLADIGSLGEFELVVNATSAARNSGLMALPRSLVGRRMAAVDLNYGEAAVPFLAWARASGAHAVVDGLGMLVEQAALGFARWHGVAPETDAIYGELRAEHDHLITAD